MTIITLTDSSELTDRLDRIIEAADEITDAIQSADRRNDDTVDAIDRVIDHEDWEQAHDAQGEASGVEDRLYEARDCVTALTDLVHQLKAEVDE